MSKQSPYGKVIPYEELREKAAELQLRSASQWYKLLRDPKKRAQLLLDEAPMHPQRVYKREWRGWDDFLGNSYRRGGWVRAEPKEFDRSTEIRKKARKLAKRSCRSFTLKKSA